MLYYIYRCLIGEESSLILYAANDSTIILRPTSCVGVNVNNMEKSINVVAQLGQQRQSQEILYTYRYLLVLDI